MNKIIIKAPAKINLFLDVIGKREDGYHFINTVMQTVSVFDYITILKNSSINHINIECDYDGVPSDFNNIAYKCAVSFFEYCGMDIQGIDIIIDKNIPIEAGLGGGSSNGAAVLVGLNNIFNKNLSNTNLIEIASKIGTDIPFFIKGSTCLAEGLGEILKPISSIPNCYILIFKPNFGVSTKDSYKLIDKIDSNTFYDINKFIRFIEDKNIEHISSNIYNIFELCFNNNIILDLKSKVAEFGCLGCGMTGSGSAIFGIFNDYSKAFKCKSFFEKQFNFCELCSPYDGGVTIL